MGVECILFLQKFDVSIECEKKIEGAADGALRAN